jgi:hypothetical protein
MDNRKSMERNGKEYFSLYFIVDFVIIAWRTFKSQFASEWKTQRI